MTEKKNKLTNTERTAFTPAQPCLSNLIENIILFVKKWHEKTRIHLKLYYFMQIMKSIVVAKYTEFVNYTFLFQVFQTVLVANPLHAIALAIPHFRTMQSPKIQPARKITHHKLIRRYKPRGALPPKQRESRSGETGGSQASSRGSARSSARTSTRAQQPEQSASRRSTDEGAEFTVSARSARLPCHWAGPRSTG